MKRRVEGRRDRLGGLAFLGMAFVAAASPVAGQSDTVRTRMDCRCIDQSGNAIQDCTCFRTPRMRMMRVMGPGNRARIGITVAAGEPRDERQGVRIESVLQGGPAERAGLREGDLVVRVDGRSLFEPLEEPEAEARLDLGRSVPAQRLVAILGGVDPGDSVEIEYVRDGATHHATVEAEENTGGTMGGMMGWSGVDGRGQRHALVLPGGAFRLRGDSLPWARFDSMAWMSMDSIPRMHFDSLLTGFNGTRTRALLSVDPCFRGGGVVVYDGRCVDGVDLVPLNPDLATYFGTEEGVLVTSVREESALGLRPGDVLVAVDHREVRDPDHARRILQSYEPDEQLALSIVRKGERMEVMGRRR